MDVDWTAVGSAIVALLLGAGGALSWVQGRATREAKLKAEVASSDSSRMVADAQHTLYKALADRLKHVEAELEHQREELKNERKQSRLMELHIYRLENLMRKAGMEPPERDFISG